MLLVHKYLHRRLTKIFPLLFLCYAKFPDFAHKKLKDNDEMWFRAKLCRYPIYKIIFGYFIQLCKIGIKFITLNQMFAIPNLKYKTSLCNAWKEGIQCNKGFSCFFAHGEHELRTMEQNRELLYMHNPHSTQPNSGKFKTRFCKFYNKGACKLGQKCTFAHHKQQKRPIMYVPKVEHTATYDQPHFQYPGYYGQNQPYNYYGQYNYQPYQAQFYGAEQGSPSAKNQEYIEGSTESANGVSPEKEDVRDQNQEIQKRQK